LKPGGGGFCPKPYRKRERREKGRKGGKNILSNGANIQQAGGKAKRASLYWEGKGGKKTGH